LAESGSAVAVNAETPEVGRRNVVSGGRFDDRTGARIRAHGIGDDVKETGELKHLLHQLDGRGYKAYKEIAGAWRHHGFTLHVDHVQGDPFATPSRVRVIVDPDTAALPGHAFSDTVRSLGTAAFLARSFAHRAHGVKRGSGSGRSGEVRMEAPGQEVLPQTAVQVSPDGTVDARFTVGLPARGRTVMGTAAATLLTESVPDVVVATLLASAHPAEEIRRHADINEDAHHLRTLLPGMGLVAFVADGALLPRRSGVDDRPLEESAVVLFCSPDSLRVDVELPNAGTVTGMGIPIGVTLIVGGGFHGKSTLLRALAMGVYNHRPGDGRELVATVPDAVKIRAEDGRSVAGVDISPFIDGLPLDQDTRAFSTPNASGSTSQAAAIVEALEAGARTLLVDEDTSATNFMIRDRRMQALVPKGGEPITPFVDRVRELSDELNVSTTLVLGGSGDYLDVADTVIDMRAYLPIDVTAEAREVARDHPTGRAAEVRHPVALPRPRVPDPRSVDARKGRREVSVGAPDLRTLLFGRGRVDLGAVEQLVSASQIRAIGNALALAPARILDGATSIPEVLDEIDLLLAREGLDALDARRPGDLAGFRRFELAAVLNRLRSLRVP
jgi:predicted ABC-class ATPase